jgi:D-alanine-D-alanine ligase
MFSQRVGKETVYHLCTAVHLCMQIVLTYNLKIDQPLSAEESFDSSGKVSLHNDTYAEWDSWETISAVRDAIALHHEVIPVEANEDAFEILRKIKPDFVFNIAEGFHGISREAQIPAMCELLRLPYLGSDPLTLSLCLDKARTKEVLSYHKIPNASFFVSNDPASLNGEPLRYPQIVKPLHEGSSKGIFDSSLVRSRAELAEEIRRVIETYNQPALIEEFLPGREFTVALMGNGNTVRTLPIVEIRHDALPEGVNPIYSYEAKWIWDQRENPLEIFSCPADVTVSERKAIEKVSIQTYMVLRCRDWARIDVRLSGEGIPNIIEVNPLPGILPNEEDNSCFPKAARAAGMSYNELILEVIKESTARWKITKDKIN